MQNLIELIELYIKICYSIYVACTCVSQKYIYFISNWKESYFMKQGNDLTSVSDGEFVLQETEKENEFLFFRKDGHELSDIKGEPFYLYQEYVVFKMMHGEINGVNAKTIYTRISKDGKKLNVYICKLGERPKRKSFLKRLLEKILG